jgi:hypothetical protein
MIEITKTTFTCAIKIVVVLIPLFRERSIADGTVLRALSVAVKR